MTDDERVEILAQAIWMGQHGTITVTPRYQAWAAENTSQANAYRAKAREMLDFARGQSNHSLGWIP